jgi:ArsR family transcriptional regulator
MDGKEIGWMRLRKEIDELVEEEVELIATISDALAHPARVRLFRHIMNCNTRREPVCTGDLVEAFEYSQATISQHMKKLETSGLIDVKRKDKYSHYYVNIGMLTKYLDATRKFQ